MNSTIEALTCPVQGNADLYGLGIRIGLYLQIVTAQISGLTSTFLEVDDNIGHGVVVFILATGTVLFRLILKKEIEAVEVYPILSLLIIQLGACRVPFWKKPMTIFIYMGETICLLSLTTWFWFKGMDTLPRSCNDDYAFFFAKVSIWHWFRKFSQAGTVLAVIAGGGGVVTYLIMLPGLMFFHLKQLRRGWSRNREESRYEEGEYPAMGTGNFELAFELGIVVYVELALKWNHISGVHSLRAPGQFMPFFIALAQLFTTLYRLAKYSLLASMEEDYGGPEGDEEECPHLKKEEVTSGEVITLDDIVKSPSPKQHSGIVASNV